MRRLLPLVALALAAAPAHADLLSLRLEAHGGGGGGVGVAGDQKDNAFQTGARGGVYGGLVGVEVLFIDVWVQHHQFNNGGLTGTWTQFMTGMDVDVDLGVPAAKPGKAHGRPAGYFEAGLGLGFGVGTGQQVVLPLDNGEVTDKGFVVEAKIGAGWNLGPLFSLGFVVPVSGGYFFKSGPGVVANDQGTHYQAIEAALLVNFRAKLKLK
ncbi:MAG: hypothetical protein IPL61_00155 [Myxococcales bacterium]|nr:hypothetical protein [Myxococcales bacterium]